MNRRITLFLAIIIFQQNTNAQQVCPIIPQPLKAEAVSQHFVLNKNTAVIINHDSLATVALYLQQQLLLQNKIPLIIQKQSNLPFIKLSITKKGRKEDAYTLSMNNNEIHISGETTKGVFYGIVSFLQFVEQSKKSGEDILLNCWNITDEPRYEWRGLMLDESRHFFGTEKVKSILDWMAYYKLNRFHWHLTDEPAWRVEIKQYPKLALIGGIGSHSNPDESAQFYTQQQIAEIINYAAKRNIVVIPEIDMPGHATAANRAYPQFSGGGSEKHPEFTFHPAKEATYQYLTNILREVQALFPSKMLHLGGDEVSFGNEKWHTDNDVKNLMKQHNLKTVVDVEHYFMQRMADSVFSMNAKLLAWDEVANMDFPKNKTIVFWWRHDKPEQLTTVLNKGYSTVLCPRLPLYFDFVQDSTHTAGRMWGKGYSPLQDVYNFSAENFSGVTSKNKNQILGIQANLWTETISRDDQLDFMLFPRIAALAEASWKAPGTSGYNDFTNLLKKHFILYNNDGINFYQPFKK